MKCANCQSELVIPDGIKTGHCISCGASFSVDAKTGAQVLDPDALKSLASAIVDEQEARAEALAEAEAKKEKENANGKGSIFKDPEE